MENQLWQTRPPTIEVFETLIKDFNTVLEKLNSLDQIEAHLIQRGEELWRHAINFAQDSSDFDDRPLYWTRLCLLHHLHTFLAGVAKGSPVFHNASKLVNRFEAASRGLNQNPQPRATTDVTLKRILISGFDPFGLHTSFEKSNTSGACILALHQQKLVAKEVTAQVTGAIFPVRYADFDNGIVEAYFKPFLNIPHPPDLVITISQNQDDFKVERFAGRRRSTESFADNSGHNSGGSRRHPIEPADLPPGPEFIETSLPVDVIRSALGRTEPLANELRFMELTTAAIRKSSDVRPPQWKYTTPTKGSMAVCGSGGGFLSNEIFYRCSLLRLHSLHKNLRMGHLHIPALNDNNDAQQRLEVVNQVKKVLLETLPYL